MFNGEMKMEVEKMSSLQFDIELRQKILRKEQRQTFPKNMNSGQL